MKTIDYFVKVHGVIEREKFLDYMKNLGYKIDVNFTREYLINSVYPFAVCLDDKRLLIIESATQCYLMDKDGKVLNVDEFIEKFIN